MKGPPDRSEAAEYYFTYIDEVQCDDILGYLDGQTVEFQHFLSRITEEQSEFRYAPEKWSLRQVLNHINDTERVFGFRAFWIGRGGQAALPGFDQDEFSVCAEAGARPWASHVEEFRAIRAATMSSLTSLPAEAWSRRGTASGHGVTTLALAYMIAGHVEHHYQLILERYLPALSELP